MRNVIDPAEEPLLPPGTTLMPLPLPEPETRAPTPAALPPFEPSPDAPAPVPAPVAHADTPFLFLTLPGGTPTAPIPPDAGAPVEIDPAVIAAALATLLPVLPGMPAPEAPGVTLPGGGQPDPTPIRTAEMPPPLDLAYGPRDWAWW